MNARIQAISHYLPEAVLTNSDLKREHPDWDVEKAAGSTGVYSRHIAANDEIASDLAYKAALRLFDEYEIDRSEIDFVLFCTQSNDYLTPTTACILQDRLGLRSGVGAVDFNQGCAGFIYGLSLAKGLIIQGSAKKILLLTSETISKYLHHGDRSVRMLFGDGATASLIVPSEEQGIGDFVFGTDGRGFDKIILKRGGARFPYDYTLADMPDGYGNVHNENNFYMDGQAIFLFSIKRGPAVIRELLEKTGESLSDFDYIIPHQANRLIVETIGRQLKVDSSKLIIDIAETGNTVSSTIPLVLSRAIISGKLKKGDKVLLAAFGVGLSWAATSVCL